MSAMTTPFPVKEEKDLMRAASGNAGGDVGKIESTENNDFMAFALSFPKGILSVLHVTMLRVALLFRRALPLPTVRRFEALRWNILLLPKGAKWKLAVKTLEQKDSEEMQNR